MKRDYDGLLYYRDCRADKEECEKAISILKLYNTYHTVLTLL